MTAELVTVTAVSDEGNQVVVWGRVVGGGPDTDEIGFVFRASGDGADADMAERASRLRRDAVVLIDYHPVIGGWNLATQVMAP